MTLTPFPTFYEGSPVWCSLPPDGKLSFVLDLQRRRQENSLERIKTRAVGRKASRSTESDPLMSALKKALADPRLLELLKGT